MALWVPSGNKFFIPQNPVARIPNTDEYVTRTSQYYYASSSRLLSVGHPFQEIVDREGKMLIPKVSSLQYRSFRVTFPDPNKFVFSDPDFYDPDTQRLVWALVGLEVDRGQPLGIGISGNVFMNKLEDVENPSKAGGEPAPETQTRFNMAFDPKQQQLLIVGCKPAAGEHWGIGKACAEDLRDDAEACPPLELKTTLIEDGDMMDAGLGALDFAALQRNKSDAPMDINQSICKYPDFIRMAKDPYGDMMFFCAKNEQLYLRHFLNRGGNVKEEVNKNLYLNNEEEDLPVGSSNYWGTPSGSLVTSSNQLFNKPYWIRRAQGHNNGILWGNQCFVTVGDTTRGTNFSISVPTAGGAHYKATEFNEYTRHVEEFELQFVLQACVVDLNPETVAHLHQMDSRILDNWNLGVVTTQNGPLAETYRFINSKATKCPDSVKKDEANKDPYESLKFWNLDLTEQLSQDLSHFPLGRRFLYQFQKVQTPNTRKRKAPVTTSGTSKRRRKNANNK